VPGPPESADERIGHQLDSREILAPDRPSHSLPTGHYAGIDVEPEVIEWLQANVPDPRFEFHHLDAHNALYNPHGKPLESFDLLPVGPRHFDLICLFSVFTP
jgi:hypothetical protein